MVQIKISLIEPGALAADEHRYKFSIRSCALREHIFALFSSIPFQTILIWRKLLRFWFVSLQTSNFQFGHLKRSVLVLQHSGGWARMFIKSEILLCSAFGATLMLSVAGMPAGNTLAMAQA